MGKITTKCHICDTKTKGDQPLAYCPTCGADVVNTTVETVLRKAHGGFKPVGGKNQQGTVYLTNWRLFVVPDSGSFAAAAFGMVGAAVSAAIQSGKPTNLALNISLADIASIGEEKVTIVMTGLSLTSRAYGPIGAVAVPQRDQWRNAIQQATASMR